MENEKYMYVADFETNVPDFVLYDSNITYALSGMKKNYKTRVWYAGIKNIETKETYKFVTLEGFMNHIKKLEKNIEIYFHNLAFDISFVIPYIIKEGYTQRHPLDPHYWDDLQSGEFRLLAGDKGTIYSLELKKGKQTILFKDSLKILPFTLDTIAKSFELDVVKLYGTVDYKLQRPKGYTPTETEERYLQRDLDILEKALNRILDSSFYFLLDSLTIGGACIREFKRLCKEKGIDLKKLHPNINIEDDEFCRQAYRGGYTYNNTDGTLKEIKGCSYDWNSAYPAHMKHEIYPVGKPIKKKIKNKYNVNEILKIKKLYIVKFKVNAKLKPKHLPIFQAKKTLGFSDTEYIKDTKGTLTLTMSKPDYELFMNHYDILEYESIALRIFDSLQRSVFTDYVDKWYKEKENATNPVERQIAKLFLNNLYGKMGQSQNQESLYVELKDSNVGYEKIPQITNNSAYIPAAVFITAYTRTNLIKIAQENFDIFMYSDTDSLHFSADPKGLDIDPKRLGAFDLEKIITRAKYIRAKTYIIEYYTPKDPTIRVEIKAAGAPNSTKERMWYKCTEKTETGFIFHELEYDDQGNITTEKRTTEELFEYFDHGLVEKGKLARQTTENGMILYDTTFSIL